MRLEPFIVVLHLRNMMQVVMEPACTQADVDAIRDHWPDILDSTAASLVAFLWFEAEGRFTPVLRAYAEWYCNQDEAHSPEVYAHWKKSQERVQYSLQQQSGVPNVSFDHQAHAWRLQFMYAGKKINKIVVVQKASAGNDAVAASDAALAKAIAARQKYTEQGMIRDAAILSSTCPGVSWDATRNRWQVRVYLGKKCVRGPSFFAPTAEHVEEAKLKAEAAARDLQQKYGIQREVRTIGMPRFKLRRR